MKVEPKFFAWLMQSKEVSWPIVVIGNVENDLCTVRYLGHEENNDVNVGVGNLRDFVSHIYLLSGGERVLTWNELCSRARGGVAAKGGVGIKYQ